jgi:protein SCO1/2
MKMRTLKLGSVLLLILFLQSCNKPLEWNGANIFGMMPDLSFALTGPENTVIESSSLQGKAVLVFFGFTNCPDVCPTTLTQLAVIRKKLGPAADKLQITLVSVDPGRDTPEVMKNYTASFGPWLLGLTGTEQALTTLRETYSVYVAMESSESKGQYNVMHSTVIFAFDSQGKARLLISDVHDTEAVLSDLKKLATL